MTLLQNAALAIHNCTAGDGFASESVMSWFGRCKREKVGVPAFWYIKRAVEYYDRATQPPNCEEFIDWSNGDPIYDPESLASFMADELKRLNGKLNSLDRSIGQFESRPVATEPIELANVTDALQRIDPLWEVLHPEEQRRVLELLVETITVSKKDVEVRFRANGIEQVVEELEPMGAGE